MADWYYGENGGQLGPVDDHALQALVAEGRITAQTLVWREGMANWQPYSSLALQEAPLMNLGPSSFAPQMQMPVPNSGLAIASMVCGISSVAGVFCFLFGIAAIPAIICGHMALSRIKKSDVTLGGKGMAITGLIMGYLAVFLLLAGLIVYGVFFVRASNSY